MSDPRTTSKGPGQRAISTAERDGAGILIADTVTGLTLPTDRVDTLTAFANLLRADERLIGWAIDPMVNTWLSDVPPEVRISICASQPTKWDGWQVLYVPGHFLDVWYRRHHRRVYDLAAHFPGRAGELVAVAQQWGISVPDVVVRGEAARSYEYPDWTRTAIASYAEARALVVAELASRLFAGLEEHDLLPKQPYGVGAIGSRLLTRSGGARWVARYHPDRQPTTPDGWPMLGLFLRAYYGGRIEAMILGSFNQPAWRLDLRSAYSWALAWVGPVGYRWEPATAFSDRIEDRMSLWRVAWDVGDAWVGPLPYRDGNARRGIVYPARGAGWYWWPEVRAALAVWGPGAIRVHEGYISPASSTRPLLETMASTYRLRKTLEAAGDPLVEVVKGGANAIWGKLGQRLGQGGYPGRWYNPALAGWVTSQVRARLVTSIGAERLSTVASTAAIMTDGYLLTREPDPSLIGSGMGDWRAEQFVRSELVGTGMYRLHRADGSVEVATTRVSRSLDFDWLLDELTAHDVAIVEGRWFVPHILADLYPERWAAARCRWQTAAGKIDPFKLHHKRDQAASLLGMDWTRDVRYAGAYREISRGDGILSAAAPDPPAWSAQGFDPVWEAARSAISGVA